MKIYIIKGTHWSVPGQPEFAAVSQEAADAIALDLANTLREGTDLPKAAAGSDWKTVLANTQRWRIAHLTGQVFDAAARMPAPGWDNEELAEAAECNVWIDVLELQGATDPGNVFETVGVWAYAATFADPATGAQESFSTTVTAATREKAGEEARAALELRYPGASKVDAAICLEAQGSEG